MNRAHDSVVYWKENVTLRRFMIVSCVLMVWIGCDLALHLLAHQGIDQFEQWKNIESVTGLPVSKAFYTLMPNDAWRLHLYTAYSLPALGLIVLILLDRLINQGRTRMPWGIAACGGLFIVGGAVLDMAVTVAHSPTLELEGNPYVRILLDSKHSLWFVYAHALFTQSLYITLFCGVWIGFLRHRQIIIETISTASPKSWIDFVKAATGGAHLSRRQWLFPVRFSEAPVLYHCVWLVAIPVVFGISLFRWYAVAEWVGLVEPAEMTRVFVVLHGVFSTLVLYLLCLWRLYQQSLSSVREHSR